MDHRNMATGKHSSVITRKLWLCDDRENAILQHDKLTTTKEKKFGQIKIKETRTGWCSSY